MNLIYRFSIISLFVVSSCTYDPHQLDFKQPQNYRPIFISEKKASLPPYGYVNFCYQNTGNCPEMSLKKNLLTQSQQSTASTSASKGAEARTYLSGTQNLLGNNFRGIRSKQYSYEHTLKKLYEVNALVNGAVYPISDQDGFGVSELWRLPDIQGKNYDIGDCEDYALLKRKMLSNDFDYKNLSVSVVKQTDDTIHAVLLAHTEYGDFVLDNLNPEIKLWHETPYTWLKKQSYQNPFEWVSL